MNEVKHSRPLFHVMLTSEWVGKWGIQKSKFKRFCKTADYFLSKRNHCSFFCRTCCPRNYISSLEDFCDVRNKHSVSPTALSKMCNLKHRLLRTYRKTTAEYMRITNTLRTNSENNFEKCAIWGITHERTRHPHNKEQLSQNLVSKPIQRFCGKCNFT